MIQTVSAEQRHFSDFDWLKTYWLFSFSDYYDPANIQFGALRVYNDDVVAPGTGFPTHPHREMEIITLVLDGEMAAEDFTPDACLSCDEFDCPFCEAAHGSGALRSRLFDALAQLTAPDADAIRTLPGLDPDGLHRLAVRLTEATTGLCAALTPTEKGTGYCLARRDGDVRALTKALNAALNGRGGGKPGICQGSCAATPEQVERFLKENNKL